MLSPQYLMTPTSPGSCLCRKWPQSTKEELCVDESQEGPGLQEGKTETGFKSQYLTTGSRHGTRYLVSDMQEAWRGGSMCLAGSSPWFPGHAGWDTFSSPVSGTKTELDPRVLSSSTKQDRVADSPSLMHTTPGSGQNSFNTTAQG